MSGTSLPTGWVEATLDELISPDGVFSDGDWVESKDQDPEGQVRLTQLADVGDGWWRDRSERFLTADKAAELGCTYLVKDDVLVARMPDPLGRSCLFPGSPQPCVTVVDVAIVRPGANGVHSRWLMHALNSPNVRAQIEAQKAGTTRKRIARSRLATVTLKIPPATEQRRIVEELERRLSHVDAAEQALRDAVRAADLARLSVLRAGTRGADIGLAADDPTSGCVDAGVPFERDSEHNHIVWVRLGDIAKVGSGTTPTRGDPRYWEDGDVPWVTSGQVSAGVITNPSALVTQAALKETSLNLWPAGTLLMAMYGEGQTRGRCAELRLDATCNQACAAIQLRPEFENYRQFVLLFLQSRYDEHRQLGGGGVQENLNLGLVRDIRIPLAGESTQRELVIEMDRKLSLINSTQLAAESSLVRTAALRRSILAAAFSGELVPQDPNDESADVLLERIRAERAAAQPKKKTRTKRKEVVS